MSLYSDVVLALLVGAGLLIFFQEPSLPSVRHKNVHRRLGLEGQKAFGMDGVYWGTIVGHRGNHWILDTGRVLRKDKQDRNWYVGT